MARFYGYVIGNRGEATRMGSKDSGYIAWAQNMRSQVRVDFWAGVNDRDLVDIAIKPSTQSYKGGYITLLRAADIDALLDAAGVDPQTQKHLNAAKQSLEKADAAARKFNEKIDKLKEKAHA